MTKLFGKAKLDAIHVIDAEKARLTKKYYGKGHDLDLLSALKRRDADIAKIDALVDFPVNSKQLEGVDIVAKGKIAKAHLESVFAGAKIKIKSERYSMGQSINIILSQDSLLALNPEQVKQAESIANLYSHDYGSDLQSDYVNIDNYVFLVVEKFIGPGVKILADAVNPQIGSIV